MIEDYGAISERMIQRKKKTLNEYVFFKDLNMKQNVKDTNYKIYWMKG